MDAQSDESLAAFSFGTALLLHCPFTSVVMPCETLLFASGSIRR